MTLTPQGVLLASGGLDSTTLAYWLADRRIPFVPLFIDYGQHCATTEYETLAIVLKPLSLTDIARISVRDVYRGCASRLITEADLWRDKVSADDLYLPYRNLLLLTAGAAFAQARCIPTLYAAFINSNHAKEIDCSARFFDSLAAIFAIYGGVKVEMPFRNFSKREVAQMGVAFNVPIGLTYSCQAASAIPCGACPNCVDRLEALRALPGQE